MSSARAVGFGGLDRGTQRARPGVGDAVDGERAGRRLVGGHREGDDGGRRARRHLGRRRQRPPAAVAEHHGDRGDEEAAHEERVHDQAQRDREADLCQANEVDCDQLRNVPARIRPALVITPPERSQPADHRVARVALLALLADPADQEDVVVDAERDQEDEREGRQRRVAGRLAEHVREDQVARAERERVGQHHRGDEVQRGDEGAHEQRR